MPITKKGWDDWTFGVPRGFVISLYYHYICVMRVYKSPRTKRWEKHREEEKMKDIKKNAPDPIYYTTPEGEKIKYIPCNVDYEIEVERKVSVGKKNKNHRKTTHKKGKYRTLL